MKVKAPCGSMEELRRLMVKRKKKAPAKPKAKTLKIKTVPPEVKAFIAAPTPGVPPAVVAIVEAVIQPEVAIVVPEHRMSFWREMMTWGFWFGEIEK